MTYTYDAEAFRSVFEESFTWISGFMGAVLMAGSIYWAVRFRRSDKQPGDDPEKKV